MNTVIRSGRFYFWPIIAANVLAMTLSIGGDPVRALAFSIVISCLASFGFLLNDLWDRDVDRVNRAGHFENSNANTVKLGVTAGVCFLAGGLGLAYWLGPLELYTAAGIAVSLAAYTVLLRRYLLVPTILAAVLATSPLWTPLTLWAREVDRWKYLFVAAIILIVAAREIFMDARDCAGDITGRRDTFATVFGDRIAKFVAIMLTSSASLLLVVVVAASARDLPAGNKLGVAAILAAILSLLIRPAIGTLQGGRGERATIQKYVLRSRAAMVLIPLLNLLLWYS